MENEDLDRVEHSARRSLEHHHPAEEIVRCGI